MLNKLIIPPDRSGYAFDEGIETLSVQLEGGASKFRRDVLNSNFRLNVQWTLDPLNYNYIKVFYKIMLESGSLPFLLDLFVDDGFTLTEHECHFIPGTFGLKSQSGNAFIVGATLEVKPKKMSQSEIDALALYALFGDAWEYYNDLFDNLINIQIPADLA